MISYLNESDAAVIVLHEIYGLNQQMEDICLELSRNNLDVFAPNLLKRNQVFTCYQEDQAYHNFMNNIGIERACQQVKSFLRDIRNRYRRIYVIGFSVGAAIAWLCAEEDGLCEAVIGYYGSRIRDYLAMEPTCPVLLFFPREEKTFNVTELVVALDSKEHVCASQVEGKHGFANQASPYYDQQLSSQTYNIVQLFMQNIGAKVSCCCAAYMQRNL